MSFHDGGVPDAGKRKERPPSLSLASNELNGAEDAQANSRPSLGSVTSQVSLDPYYFTATIQRPIISSTPDPEPQPPAVPSQAPQTAYGAPFSVPKTPGNHPNSIDRAGLVGVGDLTTPRWASRNDFAARSHAGDLPQPGLPEGDEDNERAATQEASADPARDPQENDVDRSSPWTIEAVDESDTNEPSSYIVPSPPPIPPISDSPTPKSSQPTAEFRSVRSKPSVEESAGEEILYPRSVTKSRQSVPSTPMVLSDSSAHRKASSTDKNALTTGNGNAVPTSLSEMGPATFTTPHRHRKRASEETSPTLSIGPGKHSSSSSTSPKNETHVRRHRSLGVAPAIPPISQQRERNTKDRRRQDTNSMIASSRSTSTTKDLSSRERHARRSSASAATPSSPTQSIDSAPRRNHDFSHLPPSPSSSHLQHILKSTSINHTTTPSPHPVHTSAGSTSSVAHSLLRGTQEGWSGLDDSATAEALRKLDGISGKGLRARSSVISVASKSSSRPGTPGSKSGHQQWEGIEAAPPKHRGSSGANLRDPVSSNSSVQTAATPASTTHAHHNESGDIDMTIIKSSATPVAPRSAGVSPVKRSSGGSTHTHFTSTGTPTSVSRDSTSVSTSTSVTSTHVSSHRHSLTSSGKLKRSNSTGSDTSSIHSERDRAAVLAGVGDGEPAGIPPVPPLPKAYQTPPGSAHQATAQVTNGQHSVPQEEADRPMVVPPIEVRSPPKATSSSESVGSGSGTHAQGPASAPSPRTPSKKWSFSGLNLRLPSTTPKDVGPSGPFSTSSPRKGSKSRHPSGESPVKHLNRSDRLSSSVEREVEHLSSSPSSSSLLHPRSPSPRFSSSSLQRSQVQQHPFPQSYPQLPSSPTRRSMDKLSRPGSNSSHYTNTTSVHPGTAKSPDVTSSPTRRPSTTRRLTPSSIPFFRRTSTHSINSSAAHTSVSSGPKTAPIGSPRSPASLMPGSPLMPVMTNGLSGGTVPMAQSLTRATPPTADITSSPGSSSHRKSVLMGLPSLLKGSSSRRSLHGGDKSDVERKQKEERSRERERDKIREKDRKKEDKKEERSESRISVLMGRRRGKTLSSADARKSKSIEPDLPPMQMPGIPSSTAQRVAHLRATVSSSARKVSAVPSTPPRSRPNPNTHTASIPPSPSLKTPTVLTKSSDASLRGSSRQQLPTIAGSPSVSTVGSKEGVALAASVNGTPTAKDNPLASKDSITSSTGQSTKIPRISSRTSAGGSPQPALKSSLATSKRGSVAAQSSTPSEVSTALGEFGLLDAPISNKAATTVGNHRFSIRASPQSTKQPRYAGNTISSSASASSVRKPARDSSVSLNAMRKSSTASVNSMSSSLASSSINTAETPPQALAALSPGKSIKMLSPKVPLQSLRSAGQSSPAMRHGSSSSSGDRHSFSTPSPVPGPLDEEELLGDEEMMDYIRRQHARKIASGAKKEDLEEMLKFPEPIPPTPAMTPQAVLKSSQAVYLSDYERREIMDYPSVYYIGARSDKKPATRDNSTNNYSYDDDRGDYQVINRDHLAYRYEVIDTLGKGSFGQVLQCRDHCTGESVAIKIIRNKKRFHHQALVEIKILDNLRKWDPEEKHHVIKMTEHFYFRNHLCIAMELLSINLYELIKANGFVGFTTTLIRRFTSQMLGSLVLMRHHRIVHCDLKPENILLRHPAKSAIKVIDFGSSCLEHEKVYTYIQSRFYRSPEVILGMSYNMAIDMWSLGCILAELYTGFPIFPGENEQEQLACIMEVLGVPEKDIIQRSSRRRIFFDSSGAPRPVVNSKGRRRRPGTKTLSQVLRCDDSDFIDFIAKCLIWDPERRLKPHNALRHPFITGGRGKSKTTLTGAGATSRSILGTSTTSKISKLASSSNTDAAKKVIGPPTPLTARINRTSGGPTAGMSTAVSTGSLHSSVTSHRTHRYQLTAGKLS